MHLCRRALILACSIGVCCTLAEEPPLPTGLGQEWAPENRGTETIAEAEIGKDAHARPVIFTGFSDTRAGARAQEDGYQDRVSLAETRLRFNLEWPGREFELRLSADLLYDAVTEDRSIDLESGDGFFDLRAANLMMRPASFLDFVIGRQILTWGTGDLIFINDLFPKDFQSFFIGRDVQYLKAPSDAIKLTLFSTVANLDLVYTPRFDADRFVDGSRLSYFDSGTGSLKGKSDSIHTDQPDDWFNDDEIALRLYRNVEGYELALYAYRGFWKSPAGFDFDSGRATFPGLGVYGGSIRGVLGPGIAHLEFGYYDSLDDRKGDNPAIRNSEVRFLSGYELELAKEFSVGVQYYLEHRLDQAAYEQALPVGQTASERDRHILTLRLTQLLQRQDLELSLFTYYSPTDDDGYLRPYLAYRFDDNWNFVVGANLFFGNSEHTFFGQLEDNSNIYTGVRYNF